MAIERYIIIAAGPQYEARGDLAQRHTGETATFSVRGALKPGEPGWSNYVRGVIRGFQRSGEKIPGFDAVINSTLALRRRIGQQRRAGGRHREPIGSHGPTPARTAGQGAALPGGGTRVRPCAVRDHGPIHFDSRPEGSRVASGLPLAHDHARAHDDRTVTVLIINTKCAAQTG